MHSVVKFSPSKPDVLVRKSNLVRARPSKEKRNFLLDKPLAVPVLVFDFHVKAVKEFDVCNAGFFSYLAGGGLLFVLAGLDVALAAGDALHGELADFFFEEKISEYRAQRGYVNRARSMKPVDPARCSRSNVFTKLRVL